MTELEKIERAKMYIDKLANGINPLNNMPVPENEVVNQVRMSRCFFFVSDVLRQVIEQGGVAPEKRERKRVFYLPMEKRAEFEFSENPIPISEITKRLNAMKPDENMKNMPYGWITSWLAQMGLLESVETEEGKMSRRPTEQGKGIGITQVEREGINRTYYMTVYNQTAQSFILENLDEIIEAKQKK